ncbi:helix-turn-helix domain-containing protein [Cohnella sp. 56]|uniref:helix-turn-helix domain-containing protein n=1 Tax=Cohnella sp. 56 TaxID=3113722 RepID=UPI0030EAE136
MQKGRLVFVKQMIRSRLPLYFSILILTIIILLIIPLYLTYTEKLKTQITEMNLSLLSQVQTNQDGFLQEIDRSSIKLSEDVNLKRFIFLEKNGLFGSEEDYQLFLKKIYDVIRNEEKIFANLTSISLYVHQTEKIVTDDAVVDVKQFADRAFIESVVGESASDRWSGKRKTNIFQVSGYPVEKDVITFHSHISNDGLVNDATLFFNVRLEYMQQRFQQFHSDYPLTMMILDQNGESIFHVSKNMTLPDALLDQITHGKSADPHYVISKISSNYNNWTYLVVIPKSWLFSPMKFISQMTLILTVVVLMFGLLVSLYLSRKFFKPFEAVLSRWKRSLSGEASAEPPGDTLYEAVQRLVSDTELYGKVLEDNRSMIKNRMLLDLLKHNRWPDSGLFALNIKRDRRHYQVCQWQLDDTEALDEHDIGLILFAAINIVQETVQHCGYDYEVALVDDRSFAVLLSDDHEETGTELPKAVADIQHNLQSYLKYSWTVGIGKRYDSDRKIYISYKESCTSVLHRIYRGKGSVIKFQDLNIMEQMPLQMDEWVKFKEDIIAAVKERKAGEMRQAVDRLCEWLGQLRQTNLNLVHFIFHSLLFDLEKIIYDLNIDRKIVFSQEQSFLSLIDANQTIVESRQLLIQNCEKLIEHLSSKTNSVKASFITSVVQYIQLYFYQEQITLENTAERFGMNPSYLGQLLKKQINKTFLQLLSEARIEKAKELLADTEINVQEVGRRVGYPSRSTFIRVFKSQVGVVPSDYRNQLILKSKSSGE